ncbi:MAG: 4-hydroxy-tetrahydrodipicolinate reductase [Ilumatobacter sp.]|jgi:4-hydroxy-tetrahydrodipicolinate reductase
MSSLTPRIAVYGVGRYGLDVVRMATAKGWNVVAAYNRAGDKVGRDIGELAGLDDPLGVVVEDCDTADYSSLSKVADIAVVATTDRLVENMDCFDRLLTAGVNVLSHNTESYLPRAADPALGDRIHRLAEAAGVSFTGSGIWDMSRIWSGMLAAAPCIEINSLTHTSQTNLGVSSKVAHLAGIGFTHEQFHEQFVVERGPIGELYKLIPWQVMIGLGYDVTNVVERREPVLLDRPIHAAGITRDIPAGEPAGLRILVDVSTGQGATAHARIELRAVDPGEQDFMRWSVDGEPSSTIHVDRQVGLPGSATSLINRVHDVINAPPGIQEVWRLGPPRHSALEARR